MAKILFIEPDRLLGANAKQILKRAGHDVDWHVDPQEAMDSADVSHPDIIILDLLLAGRSGVEFLYEFRSYPEWTKLPVIIYSNVPAEEFSGTGIGAVQLDITAYYYKPTTPVSELVSSVEKILQLPVEHKSNSTGRAATRV
ncbi:MAG: response regulator [bacterium]|nr:response regulator [bacterium]